MNKYWYAVMTDRQDNDWGTGSFDRAEAERMVVRNLDIYPDGYIAVIDDGAGDPVCIDEIRPDDFDRSAVEVGYYGGESRYGADPVYYMIAVVDGVELYAEAEPVDGDETGTYDALKADIIEQAEAANIAVDRLHFWYD